MVAGCLGKLFRETSESCKMDLSGGIFLHFQQWSDDFPVSGIYVHAGYFGNRTGRNGIYGTEGGNESFWCGIHMEPARV